jgi:glycopeptide antibiotics resistance protein
MNEREPRQIRRLAGLLAMGGLAVILYTTLFPFDFFFADSPASGLPFPLLLGQLDISFVRPGGVDWFRNVLLFLPLSFGLACLILPRRARWFSAGVTIWIVCLGLSYTIEVLQLFLPERESALSDLLANGASALLGLLAYAAWRERPLWMLAGWLDQQLIRTSARLWLALYAGYALLLALVVSYLFHAASLSTWNPDFPLVLGNEATGDRPWRGTIQSITFASAMDALGNDGEDQVIAHYSLTGTAPFPDEMGQLPDLVWHGAPLAATTAGQGAFDGHRWLATVTPVKFLNETIAATSQFTLSTTLATVDPAQTGPARILSLSADPFQRNLTIGQEGAGLALRLRTGFSGANGLYPQVVLTNVFADTRPHLVVVAYRGGQLRIEVGSTQARYVLDLAPQLAFFAYLRPVDQWILRLDHAPLWLYHLLYSSIIFPPLAVLLSLLAHTTQGKAGWRASWIGAGVVLVPMLLDVLSAWHHPLDRVYPWHLLYGVPAITGTMLLAHFWTRSGSWRVSLSKTL